MIFNTHKHGLLGIVLCLSCTAVAADVLTIPNSFSANTPAVAADVNANFDAVKASVDDNDNRIQSLQAENVNLQKQITNIELTPGPQGAAGADGALAGLVCKTGEVAVFDGESWGCGASSAQVSLSEAGCFNAQQGVSGLELQIDNATPGAWIQLCGGGKAIDTTLSQTLPEVHISPVRMTRYVSGVSRSDPTADHSFSVTIDTTAFDSALLASRGFLKVTISDLEIPESGAPAAVEITMYGTLSEAQFVFLEDWLQAQTAAEAPKTISITAKEDTLIYGFSDCVPVELDSKPLIIARAALQQEASLRVSCATVAQIATVQVDIGQWLQNALESAQQGAVQQPKDLIVNYSDASATVVSSNLFTQAVLNRYEFPIFDSQSTVEPKESITFQATGKTVQ